MSKDVAIVQLGTFDIANYGDLLFPLILEHRLSDVPHSLVCASPRGGQSIWRDSPRSVPVEKVIQGDVAADVLVLGGGHILHGQPSNVEYYDHGGLTGFLAYARLWMGAAHRADSEEIPLVWNAPGVPQPFREGAAQCISWAAALSRYVSVRDRRSARFLRDSGFDGPVAVTPDPGLDVSHLWSETELEQARQQAFTDAGLSVPDRTLTFHLNSRYIDGDEADIAARVDSICRIADARAVLLALGPSHGDDQLQRDVGRLMRSEPLIVDQPQSLLDAAALIAGSEGYLGSSLHGLITACSFGLKGAAIAREPSDGGKFSGFLEQFGLEGWLIESWTECHNRLEEFLAADPRPWQSVSEDAERPLADHWTSIRAAIVEAEEGMTLRRRSASRFPKRTLVESYEPIVSDVMRTLWAEGRRAKNRIDTLQAKLDDMAGAHAEREHELAERDAALRKRDEALLARSAEVERLTAELGKQLALVSERSDELAQAREEAEGVRALLSESHGRLERATKELAEARQREQRHRDELSKLDHALREAEAELARRIGARVRRRLARGWTRAARTLRLISQLASWALKKPRSAPGLLRLMLALRRSGQFDPAFYLGRYGDVRRSGLNPLMHFVEHGLKEGRLPCEPSPGAQPELPDPSDGGESRGSGSDGQITPETSAPGKKMRADGGRGRRSEKTTAIVPIFNAHDQVRRCVDSVLRHTDGARCEVLLIDDASTDPRIRPLLMAYAAAYRHVSAVFNERNLGFTATVNRGLSGCHGDAVILNSDTQVTERWLEKLAEAAYSRPRVATVTPVSNAAGAFSVPYMNQDFELPPQLSVDAFGRLVERLSQKQRPRTPTGSGFCLYITRAALDEVGAFDVASFPRGYGEENDFCMRADASWFANLIDDSTFIFHERTASFGDEKQQLLREAKETLRRLHPSYQARVAAFLRDDPLRDLRLGLASAIEAVPSTGLAYGRLRKPTILFAHHDAGGGVPATTGDLARTLANQYECLRLACGLEEWTLTRIREDGETRLTSLRLPDRWRAREETSADRNMALAQILRTHGVELVHVRSFIGLGPEIIDVLKEEQAKIVFSFHDYATVCPTIQLLDGKQQFCGGHCTPSHEPCEVTPRWFVDDFGDLKHDYVNVWRERHGRALARCDAFVTTSESARRLLTEWFPLISDRLELIEHGRNTGSFRPVAAPPGAPTRIATFGALGPSKGLRLLEQLMAINQREGSPLEFHFWGTTHESFRPGRWGGVAHGEYPRDQLAESLAAFGISYALLPSIWPETYSHTLTEAWMMGLPVFASRLGALEERIQQHGGGWLFDPSDAEACYRLMRRASESASMWEAATAHIRALPWRSVDDMAREYRHLYERLLGTVASSMPDRATMFD